MNFLILKLKNPYQQQGIGFLMKGCHGSGKDSLIKWIEAIYGISNDYVYQQNDILPIVSTVNTGLRNKLIVCINELEGKQGFLYNEQLKDVITREHNNIKELYSDKYIQKNLTTIFCLSNNNNAIKMEVGNRRWILIYCSGKNKGKSIYWNKIYKLMKDKTFINHLFSYFMDYKMSVDFNPRNENKHPRCSKYWEMVKNQINPVFNWLKNMDYSDISSPINNGKYEGYYYGSTKELKQLFDDYNGEESKMKLNTFSNFLDECNGVKKGIKLTINNRQKGNQIILNQKEIIDYLNETYYNKLGVIDEQEIIEINSNNDDDDIINPLDKNCLID